MAPLCHRTGWPVDRYERDHYAGCWRIDQPSTFSNTHFELSGHILSSLEHETWQELTGFDAISTMRGIQISLANGGSLLNFYRDASTDTFPTLGSPGFGFATTVPAGFTLHTYSILDRTMNPGLIVVAVQPLQVLKPCSPIALAYQSMIIA